jgi:hypothetical protein
MMNSILHEKDKVIRMVGEEVVLVVDVRVIMLVSSFITVMRGRLSK